MDFVLESTSVLTMLYVISQHAEILTTKNLTYKSIKVTFALHLSSHYSQD
jgi:hypothetical protein